MNINETFETIILTSEVIMNLYALDSNGIESAEGMIDVLVDELIPYIKKALKMTGNLEGFISKIESMNNDVENILFGCNNALAEVLDIEFSLEDAEYILRYREMLKQSY